jgi:hypothetical protein
MPKASLRNRLKSAGFQAVDRLSPGLTERNEAGKYAIASVRPMGEPASSDRYAAGKLLATPGLHLCQTDQEELIGEIGRHRDLFPGLRSSAKINTRHHEVGDRIRNGFFPTPDAETYSAMIAIRRPERIVEIGGGFSTLVARHTLDQLGLDAELIVIDPEPRTDVTAAASRVIRQRVEQVDLDEWDLRPPSILFVDSSHILRTGGDLPFLYGALLPALPSGVTVHVHDIYLPFDYSQLGIDLWWTEQYLLLALLSHNPRYRVDLALRWMTATNPELMAEVFGPIVAADPAHGGGSFWFTIV